MTAADLSKLLGISRRSLFLYRKEYPDRAPKTFDNFREWERFVGSVKVYDSDRSQRQKGLLQNREDLEYSAAAERRERIIKLQLGNQEREETLSLLRRSFISKQEVIDTMNALIATVSAEFLALPAQVAEALCGKEAAEIQTYLEAVVRNVLEKLSAPDLYRKAEASCLK